MTGTPLAPHAKASRPPPATGLAALLLAAVLAACQTTPPVAPAGLCPPPATAASAASGAAAAASGASAPALAVVEPRPTRPPRIGLALGGGAARGFAHIGVIQVLEENGIRPDLVVGTSAGSLVAALYASGKHGAELAALALAMDESAITDWSFPGRGVIRGEALARYIRENTGGRQIEQLKMPLGIVATDLDNGNAILFERGDVGMAVRASSAVPSVFQPVRIGSREYVDGGLVSPVPVRFARQMGAELVIAVDISEDPGGGATGDALHILLKTFSIMGRSINRLELKEADIVVHPRLPGVPGTDFGVRQKTIQAGRDAALAQLAAIKAKVAAGVPK